MTSFREAFNYRSSIRFETVDETTLLNELRAELIRGWASGSASPRRITVHGCTVRANVIRAVLTSYNSNFVMIIESKKVNTWMGERGYVHENNRIQNVVSHVSFD